MSIEETLAGIPHRWVRGDDVEVAGVTHDSRKVTPGVVFVAVNGMKRDGLSFCSEAVARGASAIVVGPGRGARPELAGAARVIEVDDDRMALAVMARSLHGRADEKLAMVGVTGTSGKTTTCRILARILEESGVKTGLLGTVVYDTGGGQVEAERTTPEAPELHGYLERMVEQGCRACVMEVSSHALELKRVHGMRFSTAVFTNLTPEHLDFHGDMESYFAAKSLLFDRLGPAATAVIGVDDVYGRRLAARLASGPRVLTFGEDPGAGVRVRSVAALRDGLTMILESTEGAVDLVSPLLGRFNALNIAAAATAARAIGIGWDVVARGVASATAVPGRMEQVGRQEFMVLVDFAHKDAALRSLLETVRAITPGRVLLVFGCGGDRDRAKRPVMGRHAARLADLVWVTSDNPRGEKPEAIIAEILAGISQTDRDSGRIQVETDRRVAIGEAIGAARAQDTVVIAGKGHESYQIIGDRVTPFDDRAVARAALERIHHDERADGPP